MFPSEIDLLETSLLSNLYKNSEILYKDRSNMKDSEDLIMLS